MTMGIVAVASLAERKSSTPVNDNVYFETHQLSRERGKAIDFSLMTSPFNDNVFPLDVSKLAQTLAECLCARRHGSGT